MDEPNPVEAALDQLGRLAAAGAAPAKMTEAIGTVVAGWADEPEISPALVQARLEQMWDSLGKDAADLQEQIADAGEGDLAAPRRILAALDAAVASLAAISGRM